MSGKCSFEPEAGFRAGVGAGMAGFERRDERARSSNQRNEEPGSRRLEDVCSRR